MSFSEFDHIQDFPNSCSHPFLPTQLCVLFYSTLQVVKIHAEDFTYFILCVSVSNCMDVCAPCACLVSKEAKRRCQIPWN